MPTYWLMAGPLHGEPSFFLLLAVSTLASSSVTVALLRELWWHAHSAMPTQQRSTIATPAKMSHCISRPKKRSSLVGLRILSGCSGGIVCTINIGGGCSGGGTPGGADGGGGGAPGGADGGGDGGVITRT